MKKHGGGIINDKARKRLVASQIKNKHPWRQPYNLGTKPKDNGYEMR